MSNLALLILALIVVISFLSYQSHSLKKRYKAEALRGLTRIGALDKTTLTNDEIEHLPKPVQDYLIYVGAIGREKVQNIRIAMEGQMKINPQRGWLKVKAQQYNFFDNLTRMFFIQANMGIPVVGLDSYKSGKGNMLIKLAGLFTVANAEGHETNMSEAVTLLNDMCLLAPSTLIDTRIQWETVDSLTAKAILNDNDCKVSALLYFNNKGQLTNFLTDDRYYSPTGKSYQKVRWSTPVKNYKSYQGFNLPSYGEAIWHFSEGDYCYVKVDIKDIEYNCKGFR